MRILSADYIFPITSPAIQNGVVAVEDDGKIIDVFKNENHPFEKSQIEYFKGIVCPGFINTHCHLELSYLKDKLSQKNGLPKFISEIVSLRRSFSAENIQQEIFNADKEMFESGIVAVGDISNTTETLATKKKSRVNYISFIEIFDLNRNNAIEIFNEGKKLQKKFRDQELPAFIVPHAPYSVSDELMKMIAEDSRNENRPVSIHNQETESENEMFVSGSGQLIELFKNINPLYNEWNPPKVNSIISIASLLSACKRILFVHNTFTDENDFLWIRKHVSSASWCLCPKANLYIENRLPDVNMFDRMNAKLTIGTDSYASNTSLSVLDEMKVLHQYFPKLSLEKLLHAATWNGAEFLGLSENLGSLEKGKRPGVLNIYNFEGEDFLSANSKIKRII